MNARHARKVPARRLVLIFTGLLIGGLIVAALIASIISPPASVQNAPHSPVATAPSTATTQLPSSPVAPSPGCTAPSKPVAPHHAVRYTVRAGDTLTSIAARYHLHSYVQLYTANRAVIGGNPDLIYAGQNLKIPNP